jgi:DNA repair protein RadD
MFELYQDQTEVINDVRRAMMRHKSVLLQSPTGSGKTAMATYMVNAAKDKGNRILFTVPRKDLLEQTSQTFDKMGIAHGYIAAGKPFNPFAKIYIGMVDTMARRVSSLPDCGLVIADETHFGAGSLDKIISHYKESGAYIVGLSATPWKLSGKGLGCWYDHMVKGKSIEWLIENKRLSDYKYFYGRTKPDLAGVKVSAGDYARGELAEFMEAQGVIIGDCVNDYISRCMGRLHIVRCASIKHSQMTANSFRNAGIVAMHVDGDTPMDERKRIFRAYARREINVLTFCDLLNFGFDLSQASGMDVCIESGSDLRPSKSLAGQMQFWGRMLRYKEYPAIINDHVNNYIDHGLPCSEREWSLDDRSQGKKHTERVPPTKQCLNCFHIHSPAPKCPECGNTYEIKSREIEEVAGELKEANKAELKAMALKSRKMEQGKAQSLDDLIALGKSRGMKYPAQWAARVMAARMRKG